MSELARAVYPRKPPEPRARWTWPRLRLPRIPWGKLLPSFRDVHVYGGGVLVAVGVETWHPGVIAFGVLLLYLVLWRKA